LYSYFGVLKSNLEMIQELPNFVWHNHQSSFLVSLIGILRKPFIVGHGAIINYGTNELTLTDHSYITLKRRTETLVIVPAPDTAENIQILVETQVLAKSIITHNLHHYR